MSEISDPRAALRVTRIIWLAMLSGHVMSLLIARKTGIALPSYIHWPVAIAAIAFSYFLRNQFYKAGWEGQLIRPSSYLLANVVLFAIVEGAGVVCAVTGGTLASAALLLTLMINFPHGKPMFAP